MNIINRLKEYKEFATRSSCGCLIIPENDIDMLITEINMEQQVSEAKPCPFCGLPAKADFVEIESKGRAWQIKCSSKTGEGCYIRPCTPFFWKKEDAIRGWNIRDGNIE